MGDPDLNEYQPSRYWTGLHRRGDLSAVGQSGLPASANRWLYATVARELGKFVARHHLTPTEVYEVGAGTCCWVEWWSRRGAVDFGGDLVPEAVAALCSRMNVLLRVMDEEAFACDLTKSPRQSSLGTS